MTGMRVLRPTAAAVALVAVLGSGAALAAGSGESTGVIGPKVGVLPDGRVLHPAGRLTKVGNFPTGGALTPNGRFFWAVDTGRGFNDIRIVRVRDGHVVQNIAIPGASGGIAMDPKAPVAYVSGVADSPHLDEQRPHLKGRSGDVVWSYRYDKRTGRAHVRRLYPVPPPAGSPIPQGVVDIPGLEGPPESFPPTNTQRLAWPDRLAVSPNGHTLLVPLNLADHAAIVDTRTKATRYLEVGHYPYGAAILRDNRTGLVSNEAAGTVSVINLGNGRVTKTIRVGPDLSHPESIVLDPRRPRAYVSVSNSDQVVVLNTKKLAVVGSLSVDHGSGLGVSPVGLSMTPDGSRLYVAEEGTDDLAVFGRAHNRTGIRLLGYIPTAEFPTDVAATRHKVIYLSAKNLGVGPNPHGPNPTSVYDSDNEINRFRYLPSIVSGAVGVLARPGVAALRRYSRQALASLRPVNHQAAPAGTPLRAGGPIKHVFYVVRENRTYDQVLGDVARGDGDPKLELFPSSVTPNIHALVKRFPLVDHVYADSEASIDGHFWTSAGSVSDYVQKNWYQNYAARGRPYDFGVYSVTWPSTGFLFDQAQKQGISYFNYGEAIAGVLPLPDKDRNVPMTAEVLAKFAHSDLGAGTKVGLGATPAGECYPNDADIEHDAITQLPVYDGTPPAGASPLSESRFECFKTRFNLQVATGTVPAFNYMVLSNDHTVVTTPGKRTPQAMIADNDYGLGEIVDLISHSSIWKSSAIFVIEDDSQDGADHVDAHRIPAAVISPYAPAGAVIHTRYDFLSVIRSMELILGMKPLGLFDRLATPMYDVFTSKPTNPAPYAAIVPKQSRSVLNTVHSADAARSARLDFSIPDQVPQRVLDEILWHTVHGEHSQPPPPGPNASDEDTADRDDIDGD
jgi:DNA-binding beta-propeller fold protein YncE